MVQHVCSICESMDTASVFPRRQLSLLKQEIKIVLSPCAVLPLATTANLLGRRKVSCKCWLQMPAQTGVTLRLPKCTPNSLLTVFYIAVVVMKQLASNSPRRVSVPKAKSHFPLKRVLITQFKCQPRLLLWAQLKDNSQICYLQGTVTAQPQERAQGSCGHCNVQRRFAIKQPHFRHVMLGIFK